MTTGRAVVLDSLHAKRADLCSVQVDVRSAGRGRTKVLWLFAPIAEILEPPSMQQSFSASLGQFRWLVCGNITSVSILLIRRE
jgi:hypothetical protein